MIAQQRSREVRNSRWLSSVIVVLLCLYGSFQTARADDAEYVQVRNATLRQAPRAWAPLVATVPYGTKVSVLEDGDAWVRVSALTNKQGFLHRSSLTTKKIVFSDMTTSFDGSAQDVNLVLAGKGFTSEVEAQFAKSKVALNYNAVNQVEKRKVSENDILRFRKEGGLE